MHHRLPHREYWFHAMRMPKLIDEIAAVQIYKLHTILVIDHDVCRPYAPMHKVRALEFDHAVQHLERVPLSDRPIQGEVLSEIAAGVVLHQEPAGATVAEVYRAHYSRYAGDAASRAVIGICRVPCPVFRIHRQTSHICTQKWPRRRRTRP